MVGSSWKQVMEDLLEVQRANVDVNRVRERCHKCDNLRVAFHSRCLKVPALLSLALVIAFTSNLCKF